MIRFRCNRCGKIVEYLRKYYKDAKKLTCSCGGKLEPVNANSNGDRKGLTGSSNENYKEDNHHH